MDWPDEAAELKRILRAPKLEHRRPPGGRAPPVAHRRPGVARLAVRGAHHHRRPAVRHRDPRGCRRDQPGRERRGDPPRQADRRLRRPDHPDAVRVRDRGAARASPRRTAAESLDDVHADSVLARLGTLLPTLALTRSYRAGGEDLAELVNRRFYAGKIESFPWAGSFLGHGSIRLDYVEDGFGMPDEESGRGGKRRCGSRSGRRAGAGPRLTPAERVPHGDHGERIPRRPGRTGGTGGTVAPGRCCTTSFWATGPNRSPSPPSNAPSRKAATG